VLILTTLFRFSLLAGGRPPRADWALWWTGPGRGSGSGSAAGCAVTGAGGWGP